MSRLDLGVLGPLEVRRGGRPVTVPRGRRRRVLAALLVAGGRPVRSDVLVEAGWAGDLPDEPGPALHTVLSRLRRLLGTDLVRTEPSGYRLAVPADSVDAHRFERLYAEATRSPPQEAVALLDEALSLWRGPAYVEFADLDFVEPEARRLDLLRADALEARARAALDIDEPGDAVQHLEVLLGENPFNETALELILTALTRCGRRSDALARYREHRQRMADELGLDPAPALERLERQILDPGPQPGAAPRGTAIPAWVETSTAFLGREDDSVTLARAVAGNRVVTVTGAGGVGKTRLVAQTLPRICERTGLPVTVVELAPVAAGQVESAVATALGVDVGPAGLAAVVEELRTTAILLVLDNCEHRVGETASLVDLLVRRCPSLRILVTSRRRLGLPAEQVVPIAPLPVPDATAPAQMTAQSVAVRLLVDRIARIRPDFRPDRADHSALADICRRVDGIPLALELAASRIATLGLRAVRDLLCRDVATLDAPGDLPGSISQVVGWSYALLRPHAQEVFTSLSVFPDRFDLSAVDGLWQVLPSATGHDGVHVALSELVESSLVSAHDPTGQASYRLLVPVRVEAARLLAASGREDAVNRAHARWAAEVAERSAAECCGPAAPTAMARMERCRRDLEQAMDWALDHDEHAVGTRLALGVAMCPHWAVGPRLGALMVRLGERSRASPAPDTAAGLAAAAAALADMGEVSRSLEISRLAADRATRPKIRFLANKARGIASLYAGDHEESARCWRNITEMEQLPLALTAEAHISLALLSRYAGDSGTAREQSRLALLLAETSGAAAVQAFAMFAAGETAADPAERIDLLTAAAERARTVGAAHVGQVAGVALFAELVRADRYDDATTLAGTLVDDLHRAGAWPQLWTTIRVMAELQSARARPHEAAFLLSVADGDGKAPPVTGEDVARYSRLHSDLRARIGAPTHDRITEATRAVTREQVVARASAMARQTNVSAPG